ncbi:AI-2E family transporter [Archangium violaceum]|uniref:AI-2E family transporter n=1 Tax=Archangium violaceum TaxID=83451 RepID=UPI00193C0E1E|nr:AI-2E family transporter [Archangium violaceum]QRK12834.1 AI-2E family transporter [Archangium violaceum]
MGVLPGTALVVAAVLAGAALKVTHTFSAPFTFAFFVTLLVYPVQRALCSRLPKRMRWLGTAAALLVMLVALAMVGGALALAVGTAARELPEHMDQVEARLEPLLAWAQARGMPVNQSRETPGALRQRATEAGAVAIQGVWGALGFLVLVIFFVLLMLLEAPRWRTKATRILPGDGGTRILGAIAAAATAMRRYLLVITGVGLATALLEGVFLGLLGVELAILWAVLFFLFNYVPILGSILAAIPPILFAFATQGGSRALLVALGILAIEQVMGNFVAPLLEGRQLRLSALVILLAVSVWGWIWGPVGALLAVPITSTVLMVCARIPMLEPIAVVLGAEGDPAQEAQL